MSTKHFLPRWVALTAATAVSLTFGLSASVAAAPTPPEPYPDAIQRTRERLAKEPRVVRRVKLVVTAYNSVPEQTDSTPCITANGYDLCAANRENVVAANFLRFGTKLRIPEYSGEHIYIVQDRMHPRFDKRVDMWKRSTDEAKLFGAKYLTVEILE